MRCFGHPGGQQVRGPAPAAGGGGTPAWAVGAPLNAWVAIPGTAGADGAPVNAWAGFPLRDDGDGLVQIALLGVGGHTDSSDNRVSSINLSDDAPAWTRRVQPSAHPFDDRVDSNVSTDYYSWEVTRGDVPKPGSAHLYDYVSWCKPLGRYMRIGAFGTYNLGGFARNVDGIAPVGTTWTWDAPGTYPLYPLSGNNSSNARGNPADGIIWNPNYKWIPGQASWTAQTTINPVRFPNAYDTSRDAIFGICFGNGEDGAGGSGYAARQNFLTANTSRNITINASAAFTKFMADKPAYAGMDYDQANDQFLFMYDMNNPLGSPAQDCQGLMVVKPAAGGGAAWDMTEFVPAAGSATLPRTPNGGAGVNGRFKYSKTLKGFIYLPNASSSIYFLRTS